jgi:putative NADPH-quinone reductase
MRPFEATVELCNMRWLAPFTLHASHLVSQTARQRTESLQLHRINEIFLTQEVEGAG